LFGCYLCFLQSSVHACLFVTAVLGSRLMPFGHSTSKPPATNNFTTDSKGPVPRLLFRTAISGHLNSPVLVHKHFLFTTAAAHPSDASSKAAAPCLDLTWKHSSCLCKTAFSRPFQRCFVFGHVEESDEIHAR